VLEAEHISLGAAVTAHLRQQLRRELMHRAAAHSATDKSFYEWVCTGKFWADREPVDFELWSVLAQVYQMLPTQPQGWVDFDFTGMKPTQAGLTFMDILVAIYLAAGDRGSVGYYLPSESLSLEISATRFLPAVRSNPTLHRLMVDAERDARVKAKGGVGAQADEGSMSVRRFGRRFIFFSYLGAR